ncbi:MAG: PCRF domain-containing protein, partial [Ignavibacteriaceae bacterium]|nr:PCRF domain-containing protein [Ignavibacteriaceae bacterium]
MNLADKLEKIKNRYDSINEQLSDPNISANREKLISLTRERSDLSEIVEAYSRYAIVLKNIKGNKEIIDTVSDSDLVSMALTELDELNVDKEKLEEEIKILILPKDPNDDKSIIMEIRAGTGGEEAALFAGDLFRMYTRYAEMRNWKVELIDISDTGLGGIKEAVFSVNGNNVYGDLKFESGVHRVQRVPETEGSGRVHTSAAS